MRALVIPLLVVGACNSRSGSDTAGSAGSAAAKEPEASGPTIPLDDPRLVGAVEGCSAISIQYGPYSRPAGGGPSPEAKRCAAVIIDEQYRRAAVALMDKQCAASNARACYIAGALRTEFVISIGLDAPTAGGSPRFTIRKFNPHSADAEARFATADDRAEATRLFARACELGDVDGCARPLFDRANAGADATEIIAFACKHGSDYACQLQK